MAPAGYRESQVLDPSLLFSCSSQYFEFIEFIPNDEDFCLVYCTLVT